MTRPPESLLPAISAYLVRISESNDIGWDDSLFHDMSLGQDDFDDIELVLFLEKEAGILLTEKEGSLYYPKTTWYHGTKSSHSEVLRLSVLHLNRVIAQRQWTPAGTSEREQIVDRTIYMVRAAVQTDKVQLRMPLYSKLKLREERAEAFFWHFAKSFNIDMTGFEVQHYFPTKNEARKRGIDGKTVPPFLVRDLIPLALEGKWSEPGTRNDILIAWKS